MSDEKSGAGGIAEVVDLAEYRRRRFERQYKQLAERFTVDWPAPVPVAVPTSVEVAGYRPTVEEVDRHTFGQLRAEPSFVVHDETHLWTENNPAWRQLVGSIAARAADSPYMHSASTAEFERVRGVADARLRAEAALIDPQLRR